MENSALVLQNRVMVVGAVTVVSTCPMAVLPWLPHVTASLLKTCCPACVRREASHWKMLSFTFMARTRWVPVCSAHTATIDRRFMNIRANSSFFLHAVVAAIITGPGLFCPQRPAGHFRAQSEVCVSQHFLPFIFWVLSPSRHPHPHPEYSTSYVTIRKTKHVRIYFGFPAEILLRVSHFFPQWSTCRCQNSNFNSILFI